MRSSLNSAFVGLGLRPPHYPYLETNPPTCVQWFEAVSENYINTAGRPLQILQQVRERFPVALHGVSMNVGNPAGLNTDYLNRLKDLIKKIDPFIVSDHICWTGLNGTNFHDLLPLPYTDECLDILRKNIDFAQDFLGRRLILENISSYILFPYNELSESSFLNELCNRTGCGLLLDLNNLFVNSMNHGWDTQTYLSEINPAHISQIHLAGPSDCGDFLFDTHSTDIPTPVWALLRSIALQISGCPILIERDDNIPPFPTLEDDVKKVQSLMESAYESRIVAEVFP